MSLAAPEAEAKETGRTRRAVRWDIRGLRGAAVLAVVASHAGFAHLTGGYVGVDVFFVISGYLITGQLIREVSGTGRLSLLGFYGRRARRILPAATLVLALTVGAAAVELGVFSTKSIVPDALWASVFAANIHFAHVGTDYFAQSQPPSPLQHFWSLSVEEQFYLVWPVLVVCCALLVMRRRRKDPAGATARFRLGLGFVIGAVVLGSLAWSVWSTRVNPTTAYFSTFARAWELGIGAAAALIVSRRGYRLAQAPAQLLAVTGLVMIVYACLIDTSATQFPGYAALVPVLGAAMLILAGVGGRPTIAGRLVSLPPLRALGDWSYSLYLWHYPLLVLPMLKAGHPLSAGVRLQLVAIAVTASALSYEFIENPVRRARLWRAAWRAVALYPVSVALVAVCAGCAVPYANHELSDRAPAAAITVAGVPTNVPLGGLSGAQLRRLVRASVQAGLDHRPTPTTLRPSLGSLNDSVADLGACDYFQTHTRQLCPRGDTSSTSTVVVLGDSHGRHWIPALDKAAAHFHLKMYYLVMSQCTASLITVDKMGSTDPFTDCDAFHTWALSEIKALHPDLVIVSSRPVYGGIHLPNGTLVTDPTQHAQVEEAGFTNLFTRLKPLAKRVVLLHDIPGFVEDPGTCLASHTRLDSCMGHENHAEAAGAQLQVEAARATHVRIVSMNDFFCWHGWCPPVVGNTITHRDDEHMTNAYSAELTVPLSNRLELAKLAPRRSASTAVGPAPRTSPGRTRATAG